MKLVAPIVAKEMDKIKERVLRKEWDYVTVVAGLPGSGKSTFAKGIAKYCDPEFSLAHVVFTAEDFINTTANCPRYSAVVYDECFEGMNTRATLSPDFQRIVNHLQLIRKRNLFIFLCLPNFFDLQKGIAVFRTSHLWLTYTNEDGLRGKVCAFSRNAKRNLYVLGQKFMDYNAYRSNFQTRFYKNEAIYPMVDYEKKKDKVLNARAEFLKKKGAPKMDQTAKAIISMFLNGKTNGEIAQAFMLPESNIAGKIDRYRKNEWLPKERPKRRKTHEDA